MADQVKQIILGASFPGVNNHTVWSDPRSGSQIEFASFEHLARTAERGKFDFFFLAEGLRLREQRGRIHDLDVVGRPDALTVLNALAGVTDKLGLAATVNTTFNEPYELARQLASLDHLSGGRAAWNVVTSSDEFTGANFRRGGYLARELRYERAAEFIETARTLWDSWAEGVVTVDRAAGRFVSDPTAGAFYRRGRHFRIGGRFTVPRSPQGQPVVIQAGDSAGGRDLAAQHADAIFTLHGSFDAGRRFYADITRRTVAFGRPAGSVKILPGATFVLGDTEADAEERARHIRRQQVSPQTAILMLEQVWNRDLSGYDPDGPLPEIDPDGSEVTVVQGRARSSEDRVQTARRYREIAEAGQLSIRELIIEVTGRPAFVGTAASVADQINRAVQEDAADGFILSSHLTPTGLDEFVDQVVPLLQERGVLRSEYTTDTLREHLGLGAPSSHRAVNPRYLEKVLS